MYKHRLKVVFFFPLRIVVEKHRHRGIMRKFTDGGTACSFMVKEKIGQLTQVCAFP